MGRGTQAPSVIIGHCIMEPFLWRGWCFVDQAGRPCGQAEQRRVTLAGITLLCHHQPDVNMCSLSLPSSPL